MRTIIITVPTSVMNTDVDIKVKGDFANGESMKLLRRVEREMKKISAIRHYDGYSTKDEIPDKPILILKTVNETAFDDLDEIDMEQNFIMDENE